MTWLRFLMTILLAALALPALAQAPSEPSFPKLTGRVVDDAHLLSSAQVQQLEQLSAETEKASSRQLVVATIPDLQGYAIEDYGYRLGRAWGIGQKDANNGLILIVAPKDRKVRIEVGYGLEPIMTDALASVIINQAILPRFRDGDMAGGIVAGAQAIADQLKAPPEAAEKRAQEAAAARAKKKDTAGDWMVAAFWIAVVVFIVLPMLFGRRGGRRFGGGGMPPVIIWGGGSDWGGGGGGSSWGGGNDSFSGGGGSFGGGGASGDW
jgi:uncharacterized protein